MKPYSPTHRGAVPPGGWYYVIPEHELKITGADEDDLFLRVKAFYTQNGIERPKDLRERVETFIAGYCSASWLRSPLKRTGQSATMTGSETAMLTIMDVWDGATVIFGEWRRAGYPRVSLAEANRRANICAECPRNVPHKPCLICGIIYNKLKKLEPQNRPDAYSALRVCGICKCPNRTQVHAPKRYLRVKDKNQYPAWCWKTEAT